MDTLQRFILDSSLLSITIFNNMYYSSYAMRATIDFMVSSTKCLFAFLAGMRTDPTEPVWFSLVWSTDSSSVVPVFKEYKRGYMSSFDNAVLSDANYVDMLNITFKLDFMADVKRIIDAQIVGREIVVDNPLLIAKLPPLEEGKDSIMLCRRWFQDEHNSGKNLITNTTSLGYSKTYFLACTYKCENEKFSFDIPKSWCIIGNELFSRTFIMRLLESQPWSYGGINEQYTFDVLDSNMNFFTLNSDQYIIMTNSAPGYEIHEFTVEASESESESESESDSRTESEPFVMLENDKMD